MYIDRLHVKHLKLLRDFSLDFTEPDGSPRMWTVIIGENGTAKTSLLQAIALTAAGSLQVNRLATPVVAHLRDRRHKEADLEVEANFRFGLSAQEVSSGLLPESFDNLVWLHSEVKLKAEGRNLQGKAFFNVGPGISIEQEPKDPLDEARDMGAKNWFVAGYGIARFLPDPSRIPRLEYPAIERLEPLFSNTATLTSLRFVDHLPTASAQKFSRILRDALRTQRGLVPTFEDIEILDTAGLTKTTQLIDQERLSLMVGGKSHLVPAVALSHGYQSTIAWIADLIGHALLDTDGQIETAADIEGLVLIDEIDLYLHPPWQAGLIPALKRTFPKVQFVVTTHSPVVLSSLAPDEIVRLAHDPRTGDVRRVVHHPETGELVPYDDVKSVAGEPDPRSMTGTEIYRAFYGVDRLTLNREGETLREYMSLASDPFRTEGEDAKLVQLQRRLHDAGIDDLKAPVERRDA